MKKASEIYESDFYWTDYQPMLNEFGTILLQVDEKTWQGDSWLIYQKDNKFGYLSFGWGSCSGCDALQACNTIKDVQKLMDSLYNSITWYDSLDELKDKLLNKDWELCYEGQCDDFSYFLNRLRTLTTIEERKLLLQELCARMPYGVKVQGYKEGKVFIGEVVQINIETNEILVRVPTLHNNCGVFKVDNVKPYLFPLISLSEEQEEEYERINGYHYCIPTHVDCVNDFYHKNHIDYRDLVGEGLAIDATGKDIY